MFSTGKYAQKIASSSSLLYILEENERDQLKKILVKIYKDIEEFCEQNDLIIMLGGGSALGSIRHGGFIPWDDDIDTLMPRNDYDKFLEMFAKSSLSDKYYLYAPTTANGAIVRFAKIIKKDTTLVDIYNVSSNAHNGIGLDIFPIENVVDRGDKLRGFIVDAIGFLAVSRYMYEFGNPITKEFFCGSFGGRMNYYFRLFLGLLGRFWSYQEWYEFDNKFVSRDKDKATEYCNIPTGRKHYFGEILPKKTFFPVRKVDFENITVNVPNDIDTYLKNLYGEYMKIPPIEKRERHYFIDFSSEEERCKFNRLC